MTPTTDITNTAEEIEEIDFYHIWVLYYRKGTSVGAEQKFFHFKGSLRDAIDRGRQHCEALTVRFIRVDPFLRDLTMDETKHSERE